MSALSCREFVHALDDFLTVELAEAELDLLDGHLASCEACDCYTRSYLDTLRLCRQAVLRDEPDANGLPEALVDLVLKSARCGLLERCVLREWPP